MQENYIVIDYTDELLPDKSVRRIYSDGVQEWRKLQADGRVVWQDSSGKKGVDEMLGDGVIKRQFSDGTVTYGREQGYGRTVWLDEVNEPYITVNKSSFGGKVGAVLAGIGAGMLIGSVVMPPTVLSAAEEELLREKYRQQQDARTSSDGDDWDYDDDFDDYDGGDSDFDDFGGDADFG